MKTEDSYFDSTISIAAHVFLDALCDEPIVHQLQFFRYHAYHAIHDYSSYDKCQSILNRLTEKWYFPNLQLHLCILSTLINELLFQKIITSSNKLERLGFIASLPMRIVESVPNFKFDGFWLITDTKQELS